MGYAGTPGMVWGWLIAMAFIQCVAMGMGKSSVRYSFYGGELLISLKLNYAPQCQLLVVFIMLRQSLHRQDTDRLQRGSLAGPTGLYKSLELHPLIMLWLP